MTHKCLVCGKEAEKVYDTIYWSRDSRICDDCTRNEDPRLLDTLAELDDIRIHIDYALRRFKERCSTKSYPKKLGKYTIKPFMLGRQKYIRDKLENIRLQVQELMDELRQPKPSEEELREEIEKLKAIVEV
ncbi:hypothetical protein DRP05_15070 [Archaeoglobales archaeon]|nr:MAG: hypothetical protein DRP05_15070 [Archaeoglobales archaeon]